MKKLLFSAFIALTFITSAFSAIKNFDLVFDNIYRGGDLAREEDYQYLKTWGIDTVINLRLLSDDKALCAKYGFDCKHYGIYLFLPYSDIFFQYETLKKAYRQVLLSLKEGKRVFVHCYHGKDRTGALVAALKIRQFACYQEYNIKEMQAIISMNLENYGFSRFTYPFLYSQIMGWVATRPAWICDEY